MLGAVIFDLDGTLVDCFETHLKAFQRVVREGWGLEFPRSHLEEHYGKTAEEIARAFFDKHGVGGVDYADFVAKRRKYVQEGLGSVRVLPGAVRLLEALKSEGVKVGLATSNIRENGEAILKAAGLGGYFDARVYREDVVRGKPNPDMFLKAAELLAVAPGDCVVVEDSVHGIVAAGRAGMKSVAVATGTQSGEELKKCGPGSVVGSLERVDLGLLRGL